MQSDDMTAYLHRPTGRITVVSDDAFVAADRDDEGMIENEELADARAIAAGAEEYLALPDRMEIKEYRMMERFAARLEDASMREEALRALYGAGALRRFKDAVHRHGLADTWYAHRDREYAEVARAWCEDHGIEHDAS